MGFSRKIRNDVALVLLKQMVDQLAVANIAMHKLQARVADYARKIGAIASVSQRIECDYTVACFGDNLPHEFATDKPCSAGDQVNTHLHSIPSL
jgi:hypothetical protein